MNGYFLISGLLLALLSVAHAIWGERRVFTILTPNATDSETYLSVYVPWHQLTGVLLLSGVALLLTAFQSSTPTFVPIFILALITSNVLVFFGLVISKKQMFARTLPQTVVFFLLIVFIILGIASSAL
ncbi:MAG: hypothetical protein IAE83_19360 [Anaerolinea sp.]|nr:hypothetical protein [Anaerolinea sp.]